MTYNVFGGTLNLAHSFIHSCSPIVIICIVLYFIRLLYKLTECSLYYIQVAMPTWCIYKVFGYCTYYKYNTCNKYEA